MTLTLLSLLLAQEVHVRPYTSPGAPPLNAKQGRVTSASVQQNTTGDEALGDCIAKKVVRWPFPTEFSGETVYPFVFEPAESEQVERPEEEATPTEQPKPEKAESPAK